MRGGRRVIRRHPGLPDVRTTAAVLALLALGCSGSRSGPRTGPGEGTTASDADAAVAATGDGSWHEAARGELAVVELERRLYERAGDEHFFVRVRVRNLTDRPLGLDLRDYWTVVYPNQWGALATEGRQTIDESRMPARVLDAARCDDLRRGFAEGTLAALPAGGAAEYYREFNASGRADVDAQAVEPFLYVSLAGQTLVTDGENSENLPLEWGPSDATANTDLVLAAPVAWAAVPDGAEVVDSGRSYAVPGLDAVPALLSLVLALPSPADARFLNVSLAVAGDAWNLTGCESNLAGACDRTRFCPLGGAERAAYARAVDAVRAMPRCEPLGFDDSYFSVELTFDDLVRRTWMPPGWFRLAGGDGPPPAGAEPCLAELHLAWWIYTAFDACSRAPGPAAAPRCHESCCPPEQREPGPDGTVECCMCDVEPAPR